MALTHRIWSRTFRLRGQAAKVKRTDDSICSWLPLYHDMGLIGGLLWPIYWKLPLILMSPLSFLSHPARWLWVIHRHRATISMAPNFAYAMCAKRVRAAEREGLDLSSWRIALNGAEMVNLGSLRDFDEAFEPHGFRPETHFPCYGLAEAAVAVTFSTPGEPPRHEVVARAALADGRVVRSEGKGSVALVCCGKAIAGHEVGTVDAEGYPVAEGQVGHIVVRGPSVMSGYYSDPEATAKVVRDGWLWTGDSGFATEQGLYITGRAKDLLIVRGRNYYPEDLERQAERVPGVRPGGAVAFAVYDEEKATELAVLVCETKLEDKQARRALADAVSEAVVSHCGLKVDQVVLVPPGSVPKTSSGKRQRSRCRELFLSDQLRPRRTGKRQAAMIFARSAAGLVSVISRRLTRRWREPDQ